MSVEIETSGKYKKIKTYPQPPNFKTEVDWQVRHTGCHRPGIRTGKTIKNGRK